MTVLAACREYPTPTFVPDPSNPGFRADVDDARGFAISYPMELRERLTFGYANLYVKTFLTGTLALPDEGFQSLKVVLLRQTLPPPEQGVALVLVSTDSLDGLYFRRVQDVLSGKVMVEGLKVVSTHETTLQGRTGTLALLEGMTSVPAPFRPLDIVMRGATAGGPASGAAASGTPPAPLEMHRALYLHIIDGNQGVSVLCGPAMSTLETDCTKVMESFRFLKPTSPDR